MTNKPKFNKCPYCESKLYDWSVSEKVTEMPLPYLVVECSCSKCDKVWTEYYTQDETKFEKKDGTDLIWTLSPRKHNEEPEMIEQEI